MAYTLTTIGNLIKYQDGTSHVRYFSPLAIPDLFSIDPVTLIVKSRMAGSWGIEIPLAQLTINGGIPANVAAFDAAIAILTTYTTTGGGGGGGVAGVTGDLVSGTATNPIINLAGTLGADRTVDLNGKVLSFQEGANEFFNINPVTNAESARLGSFNTTDDNNKAFFEAGTSDAQATFTVYADFNDGVKNANIFALADATTSTLAYTADIHTFMGNVGIGAAPGADQIFLIQSGGHDFLYVDPINSFVGIGSYFNVGGGNRSVLDFVSQTSLSTWDIVASFDDGQQEAHFFGDTDGSTATAAMFVKVADVETARIDLDGTAQTITLTAANGLVINGTPTVTDDVAIVGLTNTYTLHFICGLYTGTTIT